MTDLTPAQLVERLREYSDSDDHPINLAAALIEQQVEQLKDANRDALVNKRTADQQAEKIAGLIDEAKQWPGLVDAQLRRARTAEQKTTDHYQARVKAESEVAALRKVIEDAPHSYECEHKNDTWMPGDGPIEDSCTCWKSKALKEKEAL